MTVLPLVGSRPDSRPDTGSTPPARSSGRRARNAPVPPRAFRPDIEGLRAIAVVFVVLYHAGLAFPGGYVGVDIFFVISGFLITRQLVSMAEGRGIGGLPTFYAHRFRRLLPAAAVVLIATVLAARWWAPVLSGREIALDAIFASFWGLNYRLAHQGIDYQHVGDAASPLQHFWSLGVEEQFYVIWPLVVVLVAALFRRRMRIALTAVVAAVIATSAWSAVVLTYSNAPWAYFSLQTRAWELGLGAFVALTAAGWSRVPHALRAMMALAGLVAMAGSAVLFTDATPFPGTAAWVPVGGAALVIAAGCGTRVGAERLLADPLMQCLGKVSYSWYLWHWPLIVLTPMALGHRLDTLERVIVVWFSLVLALVSFFLVEEPTRRITWPSRSWLGAGLGLSGLVVASSLVVVSLPARSTGTGEEAQLASTTTASRDVPTEMAAAIAAGTTTQAAPRNLTPQPAEAADSLPSGRGDGCHAEFLEVDQGECVFGDATAKRTVVLFGDSHMEQWRPAFVAAAELDGWRVVSWTKSACPAATLTIHNSALNRTYVECDQWRERTIQRIGELAPDLVVVSQSETVVPTSVDAQEFARATNATVRSIAAVTDARVDYLHDIPIPGDSIPECVASHLDSVASACDYPADEGYRIADRHEATDDVVRTAADEVIDPQPWFCTADACPAIVGNLLVYRDDSHMTEPYSRWLAPLAGSILTQTKGA